MNARDRQTDTGHLPAIKTRGRALQKTAAGIMARVHTRNWAYPFPATLEISPL